MTEKSTNNIARYISLNTNITIQIKIILAFRLSRFGINLCSIDFAFANSVNDTILINSSGFNAEEFSLVVLNIEISRAAI